MFRLPRLPASLAIVLLLSGCEAPPPSVGGSPEGSAGPRQIEWQRSLDDALALAAAEQRPLLIAVNMDGESASDRIVHENYRDPAFVAAANKCVCVVASLFRHNPRDHDALGRRIPCPRLGCVTCGEHLAMEPRLFEKLLADGERVAPRHALVLPDGRKVWDLSLNFDLHDIDRALFASTKDVKARHLADPAAAPWAELAARRDHAGRCALESRLATADPTAARAALAAIASAGDAASLDALRRVGMEGDDASFTPFPPELYGALVAAARALDLAPALAAVVRERLAVTLAVNESADWLTTLAELDGAGAATRTQLLTYMVIAPHTAVAADCLRRLLGPAAHDALDTALREAGGAFDLGRELDVTAPAIIAAPTGAEMPAADALDKTLRELDEVPAAQRDADWQARFAKASLDLGRHRIDAQQRGANLLLEDAEAHWQKALEREPQRAEWWIERARTAYFLGRFSDQIAHGERAFAIVTADRQLASPLADAVAVEALRWVGDGHARLLGERAQGDAAAELRGIALGMRSLARVAASGFGTAKDWLSLASFCGALGLLRVELEIAHFAALRFPADPDLRQHLTSVLWRDGSVPWLARVADEVAYLNAGIPEVHWFAGVAHRFVAEHHRRTEAPTEALAAYAEARVGFERTMALQPDYAVNCKRMVAEAWLGSGLTQAQVGVRGAAGDCLVEAVRATADLAGTRDGLGYDVLDLADKIFEWRDAGPSDVEPLRLLERLLAAAPATPFYGVAIADSQLREALRADGRNPERIERDTVDAGGKPIRMAMGKATDEGDAYLRRSLAVARRVLGLLATDEDKKVLAQSDTIWAERMLERDRLDDVQVTLAEAAALLGQPAPPAAADAAALRTVAAQLRALLGEARPRLREGR